MSSVGETLVTELERRDVRVVFGIPGVHTIELYRGLSRSTLRHVTPRHEQGAAFMADGYARVSSKPGVAFVITGPGLSNTVTAMLQARADSVPMLVICGANEAESLGRGWGHLHEMPDQSALAANVAAIAERVNTSEQLLPALDRIFTAFETDRPAPSIIEIPLDVAGTVFDTALPDEADTGKPSKRVRENPPAGSSLTHAAASLLLNARAPLVIVGGGARHSETAIRTLAVQLDAPVVQTTNARGVMHRHELIVPASPSLTSVRALIESSDVVLAIGTELGQTDFDMFATGTMPRMDTLIRMDCCAQQLKRREASVSIEGDVHRTLPELLDALKRNSGVDPATVNATAVNTASTREGKVRAAETRRAAWEEIGDAMRSAVAFLEDIRTAVPNAILVGDSTQPIYAGNLYYDHDRAGGWFNAATGFGALGYGIPAAIGASLAAPGARVVCITGDGGAQFSLPEIMTAVDECLPVVFLIWNNRGYQEIATSMQAAGIDVVGCSPTPPDFSALAEAFGIPYRSCTQDTASLTSALAACDEVDGPCLVDVSVPNLAG